MNILKFMKQYPTEETYVLLYNNRIGKLFFLPTISNASATKPRTNLPLFGC